jgi:uncharacterized membrane protein YedE/YeeE
MENFTPVSALIGGLLIGCAAVLLWLMNGRIAGISGIMGNLPQVASGDRAWRLAFLGGLIAAPFLYALAAGGIAPASLTASPALLVAGGLLVGFGTRLAGGCTSGHGVCGVARLSKRSLAATATFMAGGILTVFLLRHVVGG